MLVLPTILPALRLIKYVLIDKYFYFLQEVALLDDFDLFLSLLREVTMRGSSILAFVLLVIKRPFAFVDDLQLVLGGAEPLGQAYLENVILEG